MLLRRKKATTGVAAEVCVEPEFVILKHDTVTLEEKVTRYFEQWRDPVNRYLRAVFGDPVEAEEITQEAFLQLYRSLHNGESIANTRAWVFRVAHNLALNRIRHQQFVELLDDQSWAELHASLMDLAPNPEQKVMQLEKFSRLRAGSWPRFTLAKAALIALPGSGKERNRPAFRSCAVLPPSASLHQH